MYEHVGVDSYSAWVLLRSLVPRLVHESGNETIAGAQRHGDRCALIRERCRVAGRALAEMESRR